jgi:hypothetical protein
MARSTTEIQAAILSEIAASAELRTRLTSPSKVAVFRLFAYVVAVVHNFLEQIFDRHRADVDTALARGKPGTPQWYADKMLEFQKGDTLVADDDGIHYAVGAAGERLIIRSTAKENVQTGRLFIKVAKAGAAPGELAALTAAELTQAFGFIDRHRWAGTKLELVSRAADLLRVEGTVYYDPLIELEGEAGFKNRVRLAILAYLAALEFDGLVFKAKIEDAIQSVAGYKDVELKRVSARAGNAAAVEIERVYETQAGYIVEDTAAGAGILDTLTFVAYGAV